VIVTGSAIENVLASRRFFIKPYVLMGRAGFSYDLGDRVLTMSQNASLDSPWMTLTATFPRGEGIESLSPYMAASRYKYNLGPFGFNLPLMDPNMGIEAGFWISNLTVGEGRATPVWTHRIVTFAGQVLSVNAAEGGDTVSLLAGDYGAFYAHTWLQRETPMGSEAGTPVETVMRDMIASTGFAENDEWLYVPLSPGYVISPVYGQTEMPFLDAFRILAQQIGWDVRFFASVWNGTGGNILSGGNTYLTLYQPGRTDAIAPNGAMTFADNRYDAVTELRVGADDVRNRWEVWWPDATTPILVQDTDSIARYGVRYARIGLDRTKNIRTEAQAQSLADAALANTKDPFASHAISMPLQPQIELNDIHTYLANGREYDVDFTGAVTAFTHSYANGHATTTVGVRQTAIAAYREYRRSAFDKQIVSAIAPPETFYAPENTVWTHIPDLGTPQAALS
jgi:hypothetical protein